MLVRFKTKQRRRAGWIAALVYVLCILAPTLSYALPGEHAVVDCMTIEGIAAGSMHMHPGAEMEHDHDSGSAMLDENDDASVLTAAFDDQQSPAKKGPHKSGQCCALMCVTILPASIAEVAGPSAPTLIRIASSYSAPADNGPAVHYRPPIIS